MFLVHCAIYAVRYPRHSQLKQQDRIGVQSDYEGGETNLSKAR